MDIRPVSFNEYYIVKFTYNDNFEKQWKLFFQDKFTMEKLRNSSDVTLRQLYFSYLSENSPTQ